MGNLIHLLQTKNFYQLYCQFLRTQNPQIITKKLVKKQKQKHNLHFQFQTAQSLSSQQYQELELSNKKTEKFSLNGLVKLAKIVHIYDADTFTVNFFHFHKLFRFNIRLQGLDSPQIKSNRPIIKQAAISIRDKFRQLFLNEMVIVKIGNFDKYGRLLGSVFLDTKKICINEWMMQKKLCKQYDGKKKSEFTQKECKAILAQIKKLPSQL